jgi:fructokinase
MSVAVYGGIEGGGTKFVCAVGSGPDDVRATVSFDNVAPDATIGRAIAFFRQPQEEMGGLEAVGVGIFGPVDVRPASPSYGHILSTPKPGWSDVDVLGPLQRALGVPVVVDTDVNAAALAEWNWGAAQGCDPSLYLTIGTGIGGGVVVSGRPLHGLLHPEMGHIHVKRHPDDTFAGSCPFHGDCLEGMAAGPALEQRWGASAANLPADHPAWAIEAHYLAQAVTAYIYSLAPERVVIGGGVMNQPALISAVREKVRVMLADYIRSDLVADRIDEYIVPPALGDRAGVLGALALARDGAFASID